MKFTDKALLRKLVENEGVFLRFDVDVLSFFQVTVFLLLSITLGVSRGIRVMLFAISRCFFCHWVNDETCPNVKSSRVLEKGTFECGNVGF